MKKDKSLLYGNRIYFLFLIGLLVSSCRNHNNDSIQQEFKNEFDLYISHDKAKSFDYQYDGLVPQYSYFVNSKLKFLKYQHGPENGLIESLVYFDDYDDFPTKIIRRAVSYQWDEEKNERTGSYADTIFEIELDKKKTYIYVDNKIVDSTFRESASEVDLEFIIRSKRETEKAYNNTQSQIELID